MEWIRRVYRRVKEKYDLLTQKKYTTIAGTLVFFFVMSIVPLSFWLTLLIGKLPIDTERILALPVFDWVKNILTYVQREAKSATASRRADIITATHAATTIAADVTAAASEASPRRSPNCKTRLWKTRSMQ